MIRHTSGPLYGCCTFQPPPSLLPSPYPRPHHRFPHKRPLPGPIQGDQGCRYIPPALLSQQVVGEEGGLDEPAMSPLQMHLLSVEVMARTLERGIAWESENGDETAVGAASEGGDARAGASDREPGGRYGKEAETPSAAAVVVGGERSAEEPSRPPPPPRKFGAIYSELYRRRLERLQMTEPGRVDMTASSLRQPPPPPPPEVAAASPSAASSGGGRWGRKRLPWEDDKDPDPRTYFRFDGRWLLGPVRVCYHYRTGIFEVVDVPWLEQQAWWQRQRPWLQSCLRLLRPLYAPVVTAKTLSLAVLQYSRTLRRRILVPPSWGFGSQYMARGLYACVVVVLLAVLMDDAVFVLLRSLLSAVTRGRYRMPELRAFRIHFPGEEVIL